MKLGYNELGYNELGYNELGYNEHSVITNKFLSKIGHISTQINPVITGLDCICKKKEFS
jgi:hypothetical protein